MTSVEPKGVVCSSHISGFSTPNALLGCQNGPEKPELSNPGLSLKEEEMKFLFRHDHVHVSARTCICMNVGRLTKPDPKQD